MLKQDSYLLLYIKEAIGFAQVRRICRLRAAGAKGIFSFAKENIPFGTPRERLRLAISGLNNSDVSEVKVPRARRSRISVAIRFDLLLLSAAALPVLWQCGLITVYRCTHQCGERSNTAFGRQSAAEQTSLVPHDSKARLRVVTRRRDSWRSHVHRTYIAQRVQLFELQTANVGGRGALPSSFLLGV